MLACLRNHEFEEIHCSKEIEAFYQCQKNWKVSTVANSVYPIEIPPQLLAAHLAVMKWFLCVG